MSSTRAAFFRQVDGCKNVAEKTAIAPLDPAQKTRLTRVDRTQCSRAQAELCTIEGGVHAMPVGIAAAEALWTFFKDKSR